MSNGRKLLVGVAALLLVAGGVVWAVMTGGHDTKSSSAESTVRIEIRAMPVMKLYRNGKELGTTPFSFIVPTSKTPFEMEARWTETRMNVAGAMKVFRLKKLFKVVPNHTQSIDLDRKGAELITEE